MIFLFEKRNWKAKERKDGKPPKYKTNKHTIACFSMTQGRLETVFNCRPDVGQRRWEDRSFWADPRGKDGAPKSTFECRTDHKERESCPFHDLRANGQFQYEYCGAGVGGVLIEPDKLVKRKDGDKMVHYHSFEGDPSGCGGRPIHRDTSPGRSQILHERKTDGIPWTGKFRRMKGLFSVPPYLPDRTETEPRGSESLPSFVAGTKCPPFLNKHLKHNVEPYGVIVPPIKPQYRMKFGPTPSWKEDPRLQYESDGPNQIKRKVPHRERARFVDRKTLLGTFGRYHEYIPTRYDSGDWANNRRPIFTYHTQSKRSMPIQSPWTTGLTTAENVPSDTLDTRKETAAPCVDLLVQRTGAALDLSCSLHRASDVKGSYAFKLPEPVQFRTQRPATVA